MKNIATAFVKAKRTFSPALKDKTNPAFRSKYADLGACLEAVNDALLDNGIAVYQETHEDSTGVTVETVLLHETGESLRSGKLHVPAAKQDPQGYGSALTYARRYSLMTACGIAPEDDDGNAAAKAKAAQAPAPAIPASFRSSPTDGPVDVAVERATSIQLAGSLAAEKFKAGEKDQAFDVIAPFLKDNEEMLYLQHILKPYSTFRAYIKFRQEQAAKRVSQAEPEQV